MKKSPATRKREISISVIESYQASCTITLIEADGGTVMLPARSVTLTATGIARVVLLDGRRETYGRACRGLSDNNKGGRIVEVITRKVARVP